MTYLGVQAYKMGWEVYANYHLRGIPYIYIDSVKDLNKPIESSFEGRKIFLGDDLERWFNSRLYASKVNQEVSRITLDFGKCSCSTVWSGKRGMAIDNALRETTDYFIEVSLRRGKRSLIESVDPFLDGFIDYLYLDIPIFDNTGLLVDHRRLYNLWFWCQFFSTQEMVKDIYGM